MRVPDVQNGKPRSWRSGECEFLAPPMTSTLQQTGPRTCWRPHNDPGVMGYGGTSMHDIVGDIIDWDEAHKA